MTKKHFNTTAKDVTLKLSMHICPCKSLAKIQNFTKNILFSSTDANEL